MVHAMHYEDAGARRRLVYVGQGVHPDRGEVVNG